MGSTSGDSWVKNYNEALKLADDINSMLSDKTRPESQHHLSAIQRMITVLVSRLDNLEDLLAKIPIKKQKDLNRRKDMISNLRSKAIQMADTLNTSNFSNRDSLLGFGSETIANLDNLGVLQQQIMREQDDGLEKLAETIKSTNQIALSVNEELTIHTRLVYSADDHLEHTGARIQRLRPRKRSEGRCLVLSVVGILVVILAILVFIKYL